MILAQVAMCNFPTIKDAADVAIATMHSGIQVRTRQLICVRIMIIKFYEVCWTSLLMYIHDNVLCMAPLSALTSLFVACKSNYSCLNLYGLIEKRTRFVRNCPVKFLEKRER